MARFSSDRVDALRTPAVIVVTLTVVGVAMLVAERRGRQIREAEELTWTEALLLGVAQAMALIPGVSRSGATITTGLFLGLERQSAARFSFLLGVPAMLAAAAHEGKRLIGQPMDALSIQVFVVGIVVSGLVGYATVKYFLRYVASRGLDVFAWYRIVLAAATLAWLADSRPRTERPWSSGFAAASSPASSSSCRSSRAWRRSSGPSGSSTASRRRSTRGCSAGRCPAWAC